LLSGIFFMFLSTNMQQFVYRKTIGLFYRKKTYRTYTDKMI